jgi:hypothetical protein
MNLKRKFKRKRKKPFSLSLSLPSLLARNQPRPAGLFFFFSPRAQTAQLAQLRNPPAQHRPFSLFF